jgi:hypothetical protein
MVAEDECNARLKTQQSRFEDAIRLPPTKLASPENLYKMYSETYKRRLETFLPDISNIDNVSDGLESRWRELAAYNAARSRLSGAVLTAEKIRELGELTDKHDPITSIFDNVLVSRVADNIGNLRIFLAVAEHKDLTSCANAEGFGVHEDLVDSVTYARSALDVLSNHGTYAPLASLIRDTADMVETTAHNQGDYLASLKQRGCGPAGKNNGKPSPLRVKSNVDNRKLHAVRVFSRAAAQEQVFCNLVTENGATYTCGTEGTPYSANFSENTTDPRTEILLNPNDGGYKSDSHAVELEITAVNANLQARISDMYSKVAGVEQALSNWKSTNATFLSSTIAANMGGAANAKAERLRFMSSNEAALRDATASIDQFLQSPTDQKSYEALVDKTGGSDLNLPDVPDDAIVPDFPTIIGISAPARAYRGVSLGINREIIRERRKAAAALVDGSDGKRLSTTELEVADRFALTDTSASSEIARNLIHDAASIRFSESGLVSSPDLTTVNDDGSVGRISKISSDVPPSTVLARVNQFDVGLGIYKVNQAAGTAALSSAAQDFAERESRTALHRISTAAVALYR